MATVENKIWSYLKGKGLNDYGIAGLMGNLYAESGLNSKNLQNTYEKSLGLSDAEYTAAVDNGSYTNFVKDKAGYGLAQWTYWSRKQNLLDFAKSKGKSIGDLDMQLDFLYKELSEGYKASVLEVLCNAKSVLEASNVVLLRFERPADQGMAVQNKRASYGQRYYDQFATKEENKKEEVKGGNSTMKYNSSNKPAVCMQTNSSCYKGTRTMTVKGILWHSTGANNPNLKRYVQPSSNDAQYDYWIKTLGKNTAGTDWNHTNQNAGLNCWIGKLADGSVTTVQTMPWNYRPWGCGSGSKGSLNTGWIQFEICEDALNDKNYFNAVYKEACELTAYLCILYNLNPKGTVTVSGVKVPVITTHCEAHSLGFGSNHGDVMHWFKKYGKTMDDVRNDVAKLIAGDNKSEDVIPVKPTETKEIYRVRKSWADAKSQKGAYSNLENAKKCCDQAGEGYEVYNSKGEVIYPKAVITPVAPTPAPVVPKDEDDKLDPGDVIKLKAGAKYTSGKEIPAWIMNSKLYVRQVRENGDVVFSTLKTGAVTGVVAQKYIVDHDDENGAFQPYMVRITASILNVRAGAGTNYKINTTVKKGEAYTIVAVKSGWGKLKSGAGWISLAYTQKV